MYHRAGLYIIAYCYNREAMRLFRINRIRRLEILNRKFRILPEFFFKEYFEELFGILHEGKAIRIGVKFSPEVAPIIRETKWHSSQRIIGKDKDNWLKVRYKTAGISSFIGWILSFGKNARIISPSALIKNIHDELKDAVRLYE